MAKGLGVAGLEQCNCLWDNTEERGEWAKSRESNDIFRLEKEWSEGDEKVALGKVKKNTLENNSSCV